MSDVTWVAMVGCEGGPLLLADREAFTGWTGSLPFTELRTTSDAAHLANRRTVLHFWGNLGGAGEQFHEHDSEAEAEAALAALAAKVRDNCPGATVIESALETHFRDPASGGELRAALEPASEYDASWQANGDADAWVHRFGGASHALFWDFRGSGTIEIGTGPDEVLLLRFHPVETPAEELATLRAAVLATTEGSALDATLDVPSGRLVAIWSPIAAADLVEADLAEVGDVGEPPVLRTANMIGLGTVLRIAPGTWAASSGVIPSVEDAERWGARWLRLRREENAG